MKQSSNRNRPKPKARRKAGPAPVAPVLIAAPPVPPSRYQTTAFKVAVAVFSLGPLFLLLSQSITHDYGFMELGELYTLSIYDIVLGMIGLSLGCARTRSLRHFAIIAGVFLAVCVPLLLVFDPFFALLRDAGLLEDLFLVTPGTVILVGISLWLPEKLFFAGSVITSALLGFCLVLFIGLDDLGVGIPSFATGSVISALWLVVAPGLLLRQFQGDWLLSPSRIIGSWLTVIGIIVMASLYLPAKNPSGVAPTGEPAIEMPQDGSPVDGSVQMPDDMDPAAMDPSLPDAGALSPDTQGDPGPETVPGSR